MLHFHSLKLLKNKNANEDESPLYYCLQQGGLCLMLFSDPEGQKELPYHLSGRQRNKYLLSIIIFKRLAAADLLDLWENELWSSEKVEFLILNIIFCADATAKQGHVRGLPCAGQSPWQPGHELLLQP